MRHKAVMVSYTSILCDCGWQLTTDRLAETSRMFVGHQLFRSYLSGDIRMSGTIQLLLDGKIWDEGTYQSYTERLALERHFGAIRLDLEQQHPDLEIELLYK